jgi:hypothetical protein
MELTVTGKLGRAWHGFKGLRRWICKKYTDWFYCD